MVLRAVIQARLPSTLKTSISAKIVGGALTAIVSAQIAGTAYETYTGAYSVEPDFDGTTLETSGRLMEQDVTVNPIMVSRVSNTQGGKTIYIGGIING